MTQTSPSDQIHALHLFCTVLYSVPVMQGSPYRVMVNRGHSGRFRGEYKTTRIDNTRLETFPRERCQHRIRAKMISIHFRNVARRKRIVWKKSPMPNPASYRKRGRGITRTPANGFFNSELIMRLPYCASLILWPRQTLLNITSTQEPGHQVSTFSPSRQRVVSGQRR